MLYGDSTCVPFVRVPYDRDRALVSHWCPPSQQKEKVVLLLKVHNQAAQLINNAIHTPIYGSRHGNPVDRIHLCTWLPATMNVVPMNLIPYISSLPSYHRLIADTFKVQVDANTIMGDDPLCLRSM